MSPPHVDVGSPAHGVLQVPSPCRSKSVLVSRSVISQPAHQHLWNGPQKRGKDFILVSTIG